MGKCSEIDMKISEYIGKPYKEYDCWQLVKLFYTDIFHQELSLVGSYDGDTKNDRKERLVEINKCNFKRVDEPRFGDIIVLRIYGLNAHVGVYLSPDKFLHTFEATGCVIASLKLWQNKVEGFYRYGQDKTKSSKF